ncbi:hypothetical protein RRG08_000855 [Elysia crispata]|uniref:Uncharacterized protein n=1 Tax=Elysia crispata TaxID=231223 RepID=A0AAE1D9T0_9GAST|nr:hypothetical protein RRG08_000855 [Elysia crispata]
MSCRLILFKLPLLYVARSDQTKEVHAAFSLQSMATNYRSACSEMLYRHLKPLTFAVSQHLQITHERFADTALLQGGQPGHVTQHMLRSDPARSRNRQQYSTRPGQLSNFHPVIINVSPILDQVSYLTFILILQMLICVDIKTVN